MKTLKLLIIFCIPLLVVLSCKSLKQSNYYNSINYNSSLNDREIKFVYHEATRLFFYEKDIISMALKLQDFYDQEELNGPLINCGNQNFEFMISNEVDNRSIEEYFFKKNIKINEKIHGMKHLETMQFYFQPKIYLSKIDDKTISLESPKIGYFIFSDIYTSDNGLFYFETTLTNRISCENIKEIYISTNYTFEIERCSSGFLRFKRIIVGDEYLHSKILKDTEECR